MEKHGLLTSGINKEQIKLVSILDDSLDQIQLALTKQEMSDIQNEAKKMNEGAAQKAPGGQDFESLEGFIVSVMRNFFLDLSVDQIEVLCTNFAKRFISDNLQSKAPRIPEEQIKADGNNESNKKP